MTTCVGLVVGLADADGSGLGAVIEGDACATGCADGCEHAVIATASSATQRLMPY
jgi:hypothetical protein